MNIDPQPPRPRWTVLPGDPPVLAAWLRNRRDEDDPDLPLEPSWAQDPLLTPRREHRAAP